MASSQYSNFVRNAAAVAAHNPVGGGNATPTTIPRQNHASLDMSHYTHQYQNSFTASDAIKAVAAASTRTSTDPQAAKIDPGAFQTPSQTGFNYQNSGFNNNSAFNECSMAAANYYYAGAAAATGNWAGSDYKII